MNNREKINRLGRLIPDSPQPLYSRLLSHHSSGWSDVFAAHAVRTQDRSLACAADIKAKADEEGRVDFDATDALVEQLALSALARYLWLAQLELDGERARALLETVGLTETKVRVEAHMYMTLLEGVLAVDQLSSLEQ